jgi:hypothetical protein
VFSSVHASQKVLKVNIMRIPELQMKCFKTFLMQVLVMDGYTNMIQMCTIWKMASGIAMAE